MEFSKNKFLKLKKKVLKLKREQKEEEKEFGGVPKLWGMGKTYVVYDTLTIV